MRNKQMKVQIKDDLLTHFYRHHKLKIIFSECSNDVRRLAAEFRKKFPSKVLKSGKDERLAEIIQHRLLECQRKEESDHWDEVDEILAKVSSVTDRSVKSSNFHLQKSA